MNNQTPDDQKPLTQPVIATPPVSVPPVPPESVPAYSSVVIPDPVKKLPIWFYILFVVVAVTFFFITFILAKTIIDKQKQSNAIPISTLSPTAQPAKVVTPTRVPTPIDQYLNELEITNNSDDIASIESDLEKTNISKLKGDLDKFDAEVNP